MRKNKDIEKYKTASGQVRYKFKIYVGKDEETGNSIQARKQGFKSYEEYLKSNPKVKYEFYYDQGFYNLLSTDNTLNFAFQNDENIFIVHLGFELYYNDWGFGCIINKYNNDIHCMKLGEDDGNWWADHEIDINDLAAYEWSLVTAVVNDLPESLFNNKESLIEKLFTYGKRASKQK